LRPGLAADQAGAFRLEGLLEAHDLARQILAHEAFRGLRLRGQGGGAQSHRQECGPQPVPDHRIAPSPLVLFAQA